MGLTGLFSVSGLSRNGSMAVAFLLVFAALLIFHYMGQEEWQRKESAARQLILQQQESYIRTLEGMQEEMRRFRHDYKNMLSGMYLTVKEGELSKTLGYIRDFYGMGEPLYVIERMNLTTGKGFEDGEHILYVNGQYRGESDLGKLMYDFGCTRADDMNFELMAERTRYLKENPKGVEEMCKSMEDMRKEVVENTLLQTIISLMETTKWPVEQAMDALQIPDADKEKYLSRL